MSKTLQQLLGGVNKIGTIESVKSGLPDVLPAGFLTPGRRVVGRNVSFDRVAGRREFARQNQYGAPARLVERAGRSAVNVNMLHSFDMIYHDPMVLQNLLRQDSAQLQALAVDEVVRQTALFKRRYANTRIGAVYSMLANGKVWIDADGNLLFSSTNAVETVDFGVPAANQNQLDGIIGASWATAGTDLVGDVIAVKKKALQTTGLPLRHAFYGANVPGYILGNTNAKALISGNPSLAFQGFSTGEVPSGFCGLEWHPACDAFGLDSAGAVAEFFGPDTVVFTPEPGPEWYELVEGSFIVPNDLGGVSEEAAQALDGLSQVFGMFSYAKVTDNPATVVQFAGDTFLPILKNGSAVFIADVTN